METAKTCHESSDLSSAWFWHIWSWPHCDQHPAACCHPGLMKCLHSQTLSPPGLTTWSRNTRSSRLWLTSTVSAKSPAFTFMINFQERLMFVRLFGINLSQALNLAQVSLIGSVSVWFPPQHQHSASPGQGEKEELLGAGRGVARSKQNRSAVIRIRLKMALFI